MAAKRDNDVFFVELAGTDTVERCSSQGRGEKRTVPVGLQGQPVIRCADVRPYDLCTKSHLLKLPKRLNVDLIEPQQADFELFEIWIHPRSHGY